jgi:hypothetical protein
MATIITFVQMLAGKLFKRIPTSMQEKLPKACGAVIWIGSTKLPVAIHPNVVDKVIFNFS